MVASVIRDYVVSKLRQRTSLYKVYMPVKFQDDCPRNLTYAVHILLHCHSKAMRPKPQSADYPSDGIVQSSDMNNIGKCYAYFILTLLLLIFYFLTFETIFMHLAALESPNVSTSWLQGVVIMGTFPLRGI